MPRKDARRICLAASLVAVDNASQMAIHRLQYKQNKGECTMRKALVSCAVAMGLVAGTAKAADAIKIGYIDPLSGGGASVGEVGLKHFQFLADKLNAAGGANGQKFEIIPLDNKTNPQESLIQAQKLLDQGGHYMTQGNGSSVGAALTDFALKNNERNPDNQVLYLNYAAVDPVLTNDKCNYWHFRWDANSDIKMQALTSFMKGRPNIKKVYLVNQDYSFGQSVRTAARAMLKAKRPDIEIVGDELHPLLKIADFAPYIAKIKASGADTVITGNWGQDIALLLKAAADAGLQVDWYTYYAGGAGGPTAVKQSNIADRVFSVVEGVPNDEPPATQKFEEEFRAKYGATFWYPRAYNEMYMLTQAINAAKSSEPKAVAAKLEGMTFKTYMGGEGYMRKDDHQFFQDMYIASLGPLPAGAKFDEEKTGWGWKTQGVVKAKDTELPTTCKMDRPS
jgi:branched-chain amino acid transport system substrate-binding protein